MHVKDHAPPHVHAEYGEHEALICFHTVKPYVYRGALPMPVLRRVLAWTEQHRDGLLARWAQRERNQEPDPIGEEGR